MKKSVLGKLLLVLLIGLTVISCKKDDDSPAIGDDVTGVWTCTAFDYTGSTEAGAMGQSITSSFVGEGYDVDFTFTVTENPNEAVANGSYSIKLTTTTLGQSSTVDITDLPFMYVGTWTKDGNVLSITNDGVTKGATITELTDTKLVLKTTEEESTTLNGVTMTTTTNTTITFTK